MSEVKYIRLPGGTEGSWHVVRGSAMERDWEICSRQGGLPIAKLFPGREKVFDDRQPPRTPNFVVEDGWLIHQFHEVGVKIQGSGNKALTFAQHQLLNLIKTKLVVDGTQSCDIRV